MKKNEKKYRIRSCYATKEQNMICNNHQWKIIEGQTKGICKLTKKPVKPQQCNMAYTLTYTQEELEHYLTQENNKPEE